MTRPPHTADQYCVQTETSSLDSLFQECTRQGWPLTFLDPVPPYLPCVTYHNPSYSYFCTLFYHLPRLLSLGGRLWIFHHFIPLVLGKALWPQWILKRCWLNKWMIRKNWIDGRIYAWNMLIFEEAGKLASNLWNYSRLKCLSLSSSLTEIQILNSLCHGTYESDFWTLKKT